MTAKRSRSQDLRPFGGPATKVAQEFAWAVSLQQSGDFASAARLYARVVEHAPLHFDAVHLLGVAIFQSGDAAGAVPHLERAISLRPRSAEAQNNLGVSLRALGRTREAAERYAVAHRITPDYADARHNLASALSALLGEARKILEISGPAKALEGFVTVLAINPKNLDAILGCGYCLRRLGKPDEALKLASDAVEMAPLHAGAWHLRGNCLVDLSARDEAAEDLGRAAALKPDSAEMQSDLADALRDLRRFEAALAACDRAIALAPTIAALHSNRGNLLADLKRYEASLVSYDAAIVLDPTLPDAHFNRGNARALLNDHVGAIASYDEAIALRPDFASCFSNRAVARFAIGEFDGALSDHDHAVAMGNGKLSAEQQLPAFLYNQSVLLLLSGRWKDAWSGYENRFVPFGTLIQRPFERKALTDATRRMLIWTEQGIGDEILQLTMLPDLIREDRDIAVEVDPRLVRALRRSFPTVSFVPRQDPPHPASEAAWDASQPLMSLAASLRQTPMQVPDRAGYLVPDQNERSILRAKYGADTEKRLIGISWRSHVSRDSNSKSCSLDLWEPIFRIPNVRFVSLQYGSDSKEIAEASDRFGIQIIEDRAIDPRLHFDRFIDQVAAMDEVITISNSTAHVAGALGVSTSLMLPRGRGLLWYWLREGDRSRWYRSINIYRQHVVGDWSKPVTTVATHLQERMQGP